MVLVNKATPIVIFGEGCLHPGRTGSEILASLQYEWQRPPSLQQEKTRFPGSFLITVTFPQALVGLSYMCRSDPLGSLHCPRSRP